LPPSVLWRCVIFVIFLTLYIYIYIDRIVKKKGGGGLFYQREYSGELFYWASTYSQVINKKKRLMSHFFVQSFTCSDVMDFITKNDSSHPQETEQVS